MAYEAGVGASEFWDLSTRDINRMIEAHNNRLKGEWERARFMSYFSISPYLDSKSKKRISDLIPFEWDEEADITPTREITEAEKAWLKKQENLK